MSNSGKAVRLVRGMSQSLCILLMLFACFALSAQNETHPRGFGALRQLTDSQQRARPACAASRQIQEPVLDASAVAVLQTALAFRFCVVEP
jgi:hypothetical protein